MRRGVRPLLPRQEGNPFRRQVQGEPCSSASVGALTRGASTPRAAPGASREKTASRTSWGSAGFCAGSRPRGGWSPFRKGQGRVHAYKDHPADTVTRHSPSSGHGEPRHSTIASATAAKLERACPHSDPDEPSVIGTGNVLFVSSPIRRKGQLLLESASYLGELKK